MKLAEVITKGVEFRLTHGVDPNAILIQDTDAFWECIRPIMKCGLTPDRTVPLPNGTLLGLNIIEVRNMAEPWRLALI